MERKPSLKKYLLAFILTILVFSGGVLIGIFLENLRLYDARQTALVEKSGLQSLQLQQRYIESGTTDCEALNQILGVNLNELVKKMNTVIDYDKNSFFSQEEFDLQLREYFLTEIQYLLVSKEIDKKCPQDSVKIIYFYGESGYDTQGSILGYLKSKFGSKVLVFSFNSAFEQEPMIKVLMTNYKVDKFPAVIIEDRVFQEQASVEELMGAICQEFQNKQIELPKECAVVMK